MSDDSSITRPGEPARRICVAGWGQPLRGDDGAGWRVAKRIQARWGDRVAVLVGPHPLPEWAPVLAAAEIAFFVDATADPAVADVRVSELRAADGPAGVDGHRLDAGGLLRLARELYGRAPPTQLLAIPAERFDLGARLTPRTRAAIQCAVDWLDRELAGREPDR